jgi:DNA-binding CsgD family transcriptional regulator
MYCRPTRQVADGQRLLPPLPSSEKAVSLERRNIAIAENVLTVMTARERQIMSLVSEGLSNKEIGRRLNIADGTIKVYLHHIFQKFEISNRTPLAALVISNNGGAAVLPGNPALRARLGEQQFILKEWGSRSGSAACASNSADVWRANGRKWRPAFRRPVELASTKAQRWGKLPERTHPA